MRLCFQNVMTDIESVTSALTDVVCFSVTAISLYIQRILDVGTLTFRPLATYNDAMEIT